MPPRRLGRKRTRRGPIGVYPVLEALGIADRVSPVTSSQLALYTVQAGSYQEAVRLLAERGLEVDVSTLKRVAVSTAQADIRLRDAALERARQLPVATDGPLAGLRVRVSIDGGRVRTRVEHPGRRTKKGRHRFDTPWREPRLLLVDVSDNKGQADLLRLPLYDVLLDDADSTVALMIGYLRMLGAAHAQMVEFVADGAEWIWERSEQIRQESEIPKDRWVEVIDFYHASEHLHDAVELCRDRSTSDRQKWYERLRHLLRTQPDGVNKVIESLLPEARGRQARKMKDAVASVGIAPDQKRLQVPLDRRLHGVEPLREGGAADPVQPRLRGDDLDDDQPRPRRLGEDDLDVLDRCGLHGAAYLDRVESVRVP